MRTLSLEERINIVRYRMQNALDTIDEVRVHKAHGFYNTAVNRIYYACYYAASALLIAHGIEVKSHDGVRLKIGQHFVLGGILTPEQGRFYSRAFSKRSTGDYEDFITHTESTVDDLLPDAESFIGSIQTLIREWLEANENAEEKTNATTQQAIKEAEDGEATTFTSLDDFRNHLNEL